MTPFHRTWFWVWLPDVATLCLSIIHGFGHGCQVLPLSAFLSYMVLGMVARCCHSLPFHRTWFWVWLPDVATLCLSIVHGFGHGCQVLPLSAFPSYMVLGMVARCCHSLPFYRTWFWAWLPDVATLCLSIVHGFGHGCQVLPLSAFPSYMVLGMVARCCHSLPFHRTWFWAWLPDVATLCLSIIHGFGHGCQMLPLSAFPSYMVLGMVARCCHSLPFHHTWFWAWLPDVATLCLSIIHGFGHGCQMLPLSAFPSYMVLGLVARCCHSLPFHRTWFWAWLPDVATLCLSIVHGFGHGCQMLPLSAFPSYMVLGMVARCCHSLPFHHTWFWAWLPDVATLCLSIVHGFGHGCQVLPLSAFPSYMVLGMVARCCHSLHPAFVLCLHISLSCVFRPPYFLCPECST